MLSLDNRYVQNKKAFVLNKGKFQVSCYFRMTPFSLCVTHLNLYIKYIFKFFSENYALFLYFD
jgi:hypothetical protein